MFKTLFILTQPPGLSWYRCLSYTKHMGIKTETWPKYTPDKLPNWEQAIIFDEKPMYGLFEAAAGANVIVCQRLSTQKGLAILMALKHKLHKKVFVEIDDDAFNVDSSNPAFNSVHGDSESIWWFKKQLEMADGVITSTEPLKKIYKPYCKNIHVVPNGIDFGTWDKVKKAPGKKIKIGWQGAWHHYDDLAIIASTIPKLLKKYQVEFHFFGYVPDFLKDYVIEHPMVHIDKYPKGIAKEKLSIMLAPLQDTHFNRGKSNIRVLEAGALRLPVVASKNKNLPYAKTITDGVDGLLAEKGEWMEKISQLIEDAELREKLGDNLYRTVKDKYNAKKIAKDYEKILRGK